MIQQKKWFKKNEKYDLGRNIIKLVDNQRLASEVDQRLIYLRSQLSQHINVALSSSEDEEIHLSVIESVPPSCGFNLPYQKMHIDVKQLHEDSLSDKAYIGLVALQPANEG